MKRKIYEKLLNWKERGCEKPLMIIGSRQIGKTYIIEKFCRNEFENFVEINLKEDSRIGEIFKEKIDFKEKVEKMQIMVTGKIDFEHTIIFFDEIQDSEELISSLKAFCESETKYNIICAGSLLGVKLHRFHQSFPVGKVDMINMYPMDFEEFLWAMYGELNSNLIDMIKKCYAENKPMEESLHMQLLDKYKLYLCVGGMPDSINSLLKAGKSLLNYDETFLKGIIDAYINDMGQYVTNKQEQVKIEQIYNSIPTQLGNVSNKFQYSKINKSARSSTYELSMNWLLSSSMIYKCNLLKNVEIPPRAFLNYDYFKLYLNDVGILRTVLNVQLRDIYGDNLYTYKGVIAENYVACEFASKEYDLIYWKSKSTAEVDFILYNEDGLIPVEVKAMNHNRSKSLNEYMNKYKPKYGIRISSKNFGFENGIKSVPLYAVFLI